jgi:hypothetical protein
MYLSLRIFVWYNANVWLLYVSCAWVAGIFLGSEVGLPQFALAFGLIPFALIPFFSNCRETLIITIDKVTISCRFLVVQSVGSITPFRIGKTQAVCEN